MTSLISSAWLAGYEVAFPSRHSMIVHSFFLTMGKLCAHIFAPTHYDRSSMSQLGFTKKHLVKKRRSAHAPESRQWVDLFQLQVTPAIVRCPENVSRCRIASTWRSNQPTRSAMNANTPIPFDQHGQSNSESAKQLRQSGQQPEPKPES